MKTATYQNFGPMRGLLVFLRPEVSGEQLWRVKVTVDRDLGDGNVQRDEATVMAPHPVHLRVMRDIVFGQISELVREADDCKVSMEFFVPRRRKGRPC